MRSSSEAATRDAAERTRTGSRSSTRSSAAAAPAPPSFRGRTCTAPSPSATAATSTLSRRRADLPVDRRLIYIEPDPGGAPPQFHDHPPRSPAPWGPSTKKVGVIENVIAAAHKLPRAETIREDIERLLERNR